MSRAAGTVSPARTASRPGARSRLARFLPFTDLRRLGAKDLHGDALAALAILFLAVPQGIAYAMIAGLPPATGLYAAAVPAIVGSLFRSSRHVVSGPTNAVSLLVGSAVASFAASHDADAITVAITLAILVGALQVGAGLLRLDVLVDYVSLPVLRGYVTGAAILIGAGQLANVTGTRGRSGNLVDIVGGWIEGIGAAEPMPIAIAIGTAGAILALRWADRRIPGSILVVAGGIVASVAFDLPAHGVRTIGDVEPIPLGLPPLTLPALALAPALVPAAIACAVLSLVESSSVARAIAARSGQRVDMAAEFTGQGLANVAAGLTGAYPVGGSLTRSILLERAGGRTRLAGVLSGATMIVVLLGLGPLLDATPVPTLAGLILVIAVDLLDARAIRAALGGTLGDRLGFLVTLVGTALLPLDRAIYLGVGVGVVRFLQSARLLVPRELVIGAKGRFREIDPEFETGHRRCEAIRILNLNGPIFFAVAGELAAALERRIGAPELRVLIVRLWQARELDVTTASVLATTAERLAAERRTLLLVGLRPAERALLERTGLAARIGRENVFVRDRGEPSAMAPAIGRALERAGAHACGARCPLAEYLERDAARPAVGEDGSLLAPWPSPSPGPSRRP